MNGLDLLLIVLAIVAVVGGWRLGFLTRAMSWVGAGLGLTLAILVVPNLLNRMELSSETATLLLGAVSLVFLASVGQGIGSSLGSRLRSPVRSGAGRKADAVGGSLLGVLGVAVLAWLVLPVMSQTDGWPASAARNSVIARFTVDHFPDPPDQVVDLERQLAGGDFPELFSGLRPAPELPPAPTSSPITQEVLDRLSASTARVEGAACGAVQSGSGFMVAPGLMATNAHVVAATTSVNLFTPRNESFEGRVVAFDPKVDLALIATDMVGPALPIAEPVEGDRGLVLGYPAGGDLDPSPYELGELLEARGYDIYDDEVVDRSLMVLSGDLAPGDSGSAVVRADGTVIGTAVAIAPDRPGVAYALNGSHLRSMLATAPGGPVDTGPCLR